MARCGRRLSSLGTSCQDTVRILIWHTWRVQTARTVCGILVREPPCLAISSISLLTSPFPPPSVRSHPAVLWEAALILPRLRVPLGVCFVFVTHRRPHQSLGHMDDHHRARTRNDSDTSSTPTASTALSIRSRHAAHRYALLTAITPPSDGKHGSRRAWYKPSRLV